ncbi:MAG: glycine--tRNA ligase subunit beta [Aphanocapsa feldmannii 288cV]|nr:MAG: glycine--tRNA ligase subunit beta [Aphanocapsa feldmannii 288cV]
MATFLLEIGSEELPATFCASAGEQLQQLATEALKHWHLPLGTLSISSFSTPRRLALLIEDLPERQPERREERKGPPAAQAFHDGRPSRAAIGFARRCGVAPESLQVRDTPRGAFVFAHRIEPGRSSGSLLAEAIPRWIAAIQGKRFMRWGEGELRFSRPIRWLVALQDDRILPVSLGSGDTAVSSAALSRGLRRGSDPSPLPIPHADAYLSSLATAGVMADRAARRAAITELIETEASALQATAQLEAPLLEELVDLVEAPGILVGSIAERYLDLPAEVSAMVMTSHQRYVPLFTGTADPLALDARGTLLPRFLVITNGADPDAGDSIRRGNERVLRARLADGAFFYEQDRKASLETLLPGLAAMTFAEGLGSLEDRRQRLIASVDALAMRLELPVEVAGPAHRAAELCKADLVSRMVCEFPELQGLMGGKYALCSGESRAVAVAIREHYLPRGAADDLPASPAGQLLALADRLDLLVGIFCTGQRPSGSSDPFALRRAGNGLLRILAAAGWEPDLTAVLQEQIAATLDTLTTLSPKREQLTQDLEHFLGQRLLALLEERGVDHDIAAAVFAIKPPLRRPLDVLQRADLLQGLRASGGLAPIQTVVQRAARLAVKGDLARDVVDPEAVVDPSLFSSKASERAFLAALQQLAPLAAGRDRDSYESLVRGLQAVAPQLAAFFDGEDSVLVMADDPAIRRNRLNLLGLLRNQAAALADFSVLTG